MYRKEYGPISPTNVAAFLILQREFPRAVHFCLHEADRSLHAITGNPSGTSDNAPERALGRLCAELTYAEIQDIVRQGLHEFLDNLQYRLNEIDQAIFETFFALRPVQKEQA
jgi:uncharacterized alpha-E superfamily protein